MRVRHHHSPHPCEGEKESLLRRKPINQYAFFRLLSLLKGSEGDLDATTIGEVLAQRQQSIDMNIQDLEFVVLLDGDCCESAEFLSICWCPPGAKIAVFVEFSSLIVEGMREFVTDDRTNSTVVNRIVRGKDEEGLLEKGSRKDDLVERWILNTRSNG